MNQERFERECRYGMSMAVARELRREGVLSRDEYRQFETMMKRKYRPLIGRIMPGIP